MSDDPNDRTERTSEPVEDRFEYVATMETSVAATAVATGRRRLSTPMVVASWLGIVAISAVSVLARLGFIVPLATVVLATVLVTFVLQIDPFVRWQLKRYYSSLLGVNVVVEVGPSGMTVSQADLKSDIPWTSVTNVKANDTAIVFLNGRLPFAIMPGSAFASPASRDAFLSRVRSRIRQSA